MNRKEKVLAYFEEAAQTPLLFSEIVMILDVAEEDTAELEQILEELVTEGYLIRTKKKRYCAAIHMGCVRGRYVGNERGFGFVEAPGEENDLFIPPEWTNGAIHNDTVLAKIITAKADGKRAEGEIVTVLKRNNQAIVGTFDKSDNFGFVTPDEKRIPIDIFIPFDGVNGARTDDKVVVEIIKWESTKRNPEGRIIEILGSKQELGVDILSIIRQHNIHEEFPDQVINEVGKISQTVSEKDINDRLDLRNEDIVTIDGEDAKDLDDAVNVVKLENGNYRLGVHIADVGHYVRRGNYLDKEAFERGTSVYLVDRVIPMLPRELSNGICSLNPKVDRLTLSVIMEIDPKGNVIDQKIAKSVIKTKERMTYTNVTKILEGDPEQCERYKDLVPHFMFMKELKDILKSKRMSRGSIDFDFPEAKVILDDAGKPIEVKKYEITESNHIIEEFMLICNETVAEHFFWNNLPFVYRVHEPPSEDSIKDFAEFVVNFGYSIKHSAKIHPKEFQKLLLKIKGTSEQRIISTVMLRSLMKARYSAENLGHFGLSAKYYCHFTSPIRRYPDLTIHRIIKDFIDGKDVNLEELAQFVFEAAEQSSERELAAQEAERDTEDLKKAEYMADRIGEVYEGVISSVTSFGMFVELENTIEGLIRMVDLEDDYYIFDEKNRYLIGEHRKKVYRIGDVIEIQVARVDVVNRQIDFVLHQDSERVVWKKPVRKKPSSAIIETKKPEKKNKNSEAKRYLKKNSKKRSSEGSKRKGKKNGA